MVSTEELKKMADVGERMQLTDVPDTFIGKLVSEETRIDARDRNCLYLDIEYKGKVITQKLTPMHITEFVSALKKLEITNTSEIMNKDVEWSVKNFRIGNPRHLPTRIIEAG